MSSPQQMPLVLIEATVPISEAGAAPQDQWPEIGNLETELLAEFAAGRRLRRLFWLDPASRRIPIAAAIRVWIEE